MLKDFNRIYAIEIDLNNLEITYNTNALFTNHDVNTSTLVIRIVNKEIPFNLTNCNVTALFKCVDGNVYKQDTTILEDEDGCVGIDLKGDVLQSGTNTLTLKIVYDNTDIIFTPNMTYKVVSTIEDGIVADDRVSIIQEILNDVQLTSEQVKQLKQQVTEKITEIDEDYKLFLEKIKQEVSEEIEEIKSNVKDGKTPNIQIGNVVTASSSEQAMVTRKGTDEEPIFDFVLPKGDKGDSGDSGVFIGSISQAPSDANLVIDNSIPSKYTNLFDKVDYDYQGKQHNSIKEVNDANVEYLISKEKNLVTTNIIDSTLTLTTDKYQTTTMEDNTTIVLPQVSNYTEIHLFFDTESELTLILPSIKWQGDISIEANKTYEFIFTYTDSWLGGCVVYE